MKPEERAAQANAILSTPLFHTLMDEMEATAVNACVNAPPVDHETRAAFAAEVRAIRSFKAKLKALVSDVNSPRKGAPA